MDIRGLSCRLEKTTNFLQTPANIELDSAYPTAPLRPLNRPPPQVKSRGLEIKKCWLGRIPFAPLQILKQKAWAKWQKKVAQLSSKRSHSGKTVEPQHERHVDAASHMAGKWCGHTKDLENLSRKLKSKLQGKAAAWSPPPVHP